MISFINAYLHGQIYWITYVPQDHLSQAPLSSCFLLHSPHHRHPHLHNHPHSQEQQCCTEHQIYLTVQCANINANKTFSLSADLTTSRSSF